MFFPGGGHGMTSAMDDMNLIQQRHHHLVVREIGEEIDLEIGPVDDDPSFVHNSLLEVEPHESSAKEHADDKLLIGSLLPNEDQDSSKSQSGKRKKKVVKRWREEWADTYKWAYVDVKDGTTRIFCSVCREYGRKHRRNPYGNEGSKNMQMSALEEHNNSLLHKEALRLQQASKDKIIVDKPIYVKALMSKTAGSIVEAALRRDPHEAEFIQFVQEVVHSLERLISKNSNSVNTMERLLEPERTIIFRVPWVDDRGETHVNRGFRVHFNQTIGPCRGGLRFHPSMNLSIAKFLGFEQTLKNALSPYRLGGSSGGSDFDPKGKSDNEIMRFCQSFMNELYRYLGPDTISDGCSTDVLEKNSSHRGRIGRDFGHLLHLSDNTEVFLQMDGHLSTANLKREGDYFKISRGWTRFNALHNLQVADILRFTFLGDDFSVTDLPSEDMGVGTREMGYLFGQYRRLTGHSQGSFTGPRVNWSGLRTEATGYGLVFFTQLMLAEMNKELKGLRCAVSGCGKISMHVLEKLIAYQAVPITVSDSKGYLVDEDGFDFVKVSFLRDIKAQNRSLRDYSKTYARAKYYDESKPWNERFDVAFPCASQNEIDQSDAINLVNSGCHILVEGSNMPCTPEAVDVLRKAHILVAPSMAAGVGGVIAGELELRECSLNWTPEDFESKLQEAMKQTYQKALKTATELGYLKESPETLVHGAAISAFLTIAGSMADQGCA